MSWFNNLKVGTKLVGSFVLVALIAAIVGLVGVVNLKKLEEADTTMYQKLTVPLGEIGEASTAFQRLRCNLTEMTNASPEEMKDLEGRVSERWKEIDTLLESYGKTLVTAEGKKRMEELNGAIKGFKDKHDTYESLLAKGQKGEALALWKGALDKDRKVVQEQIDWMFDAKVKIAKETSESNTALANQAVMTMSVFACLALVLGVMIGVYISRSIGVPLRQGVGIAEAIAAGDLTKRVDQETLGRKDELGQLGVAMDSMVVKLQSVIGDVKSAADNVAAGSQELSSGSEQMSQGATEQAAAAEEASSSMEQMTSNIRQNADNALQTEKIAIKSAQDAQEGGKAVVATVGAMKDIAGKISIIEEIARQTNLLALNAAIEAARAGEHGKGFAVVASEVRKLAERSQKAAAEISELSASSVDVAERAGELLQKMVPDIQRTAELVQEISAASREQDTGAEQINKAIQQLDQVIQQNAGASEEMASTAEELSSQAEQLQNAVAFFRIDGMTTARRATTPSRPMKKPATKPVMQHFASHTAANGYKKAVGHDLDLGEGSDKLDAEFEKF